MLTEEQPILCAPADLPGWLRLFDHHALPVLAQTGERLSELALNEEVVDAHLLSEAVSSDPLMILKLLAHVAELRADREGGSPETALEAVVMLGVPPFFAAFSGMPTVEGVLGHSPANLEGFGAVLKRSRRAARFAMGFAVHRMDYDAAVLHEAALLHDFAELLLWVKAPTLALSIREKQLADPTLRSARVQRELLHIELGDLQHALMVKWRLPPLLTEITDSHSSTSKAQLRNVQLAIRAARHSANSWDNAALPDDIAEIGELLQLSHDPVLRLLRDIDSD